MKNHADASSGRRARPSPRGRTPLIPEEILQLDAALVRAFRTIQELRQELPAARHIKFPPLPSIFSESIVIAATPRIFGPGWTARYGGSICDVLIEDDQGENRRVEVKATGAHAFQELKAKDLKADFLVWVRFGRRFDVGRGSIEIAILSEPARFIPDACRLDTARFERRVGATDALRILSFDSLETLLQDPGVFPNPGEATVD
ncbi:MAG: hypothetical protein ACYC61_27210 [Isosphaeraceae bacterium]